MLNRRLRGVAAGLAALVLASSGALVAFPVPALAQATCEPRANGQQHCEIREERPGNGGADGDGGGGGGDGGDGGGGSNTCSHQGDVVPCQHPDYGWYAGDGCYLREAHPQPDQEPPEGSDPNGSWFVRTCSLQGAAGADPGGSLVWLARAEVPPSPEELANELVARLGLRSPQIGLAPDPSGAGLVGLPVHMWTETGPSVWDEMTDSTTRAGLTVWITARSVGIEWNMGDGAVVFCDNPGTPYDSSFGAEPSPTCGHVYQRPSLGEPDGRYSITATTQWHISWGSSIGASDAFSTFLPSQTALTIHELQVVTS